MEGRTKTDSRILIARYTANASGVVPAFNSGYQYTKNETVSNGIYTVEIKSENDFTSCSFNVKSKSNLLTVEYLKVTDKVTSMSNMFISCSSLTRLYASNWDTGNVTDMGYMFYQCYQLAQLDTSNWDVSKVTNMHNIYSAIALHLLI